MATRTGIVLIFLAVFAFVAAEDGESKESVIEQLVVETLVMPESCTITSEMGDTLQIHYTGRLMDGKVIDTSLSREPLVVELGKRSVITGLEQALVGVCEGQKIKAMIPAHLAYGKRGYPPTIPGDSTLEFEVEVISLSQQTPWQKLINDILPLLCLALVPTLLGLVGLYLYNKAHAQPQGKKKSKDKKSKKK
ncbi:peptidyl-prolyl cis-trans isomerase FKBP11 isoform X1 [Danio rerio]|uniref:peptidylprolyl isomerase n=1 Tax=Danio rerio TaxID=7955 RepID=Q7ZZA3_DANRE|nr:peptidyl-prolyl cis-trans isomerase FKBP11 precursor [Danio rerio]XP_005165755.1 peptidyl-prolyl cis-trans isomerase FKBP11 isoform X1 [Danio rerio]AAI54505.1 FK506 binding protein 11 [Danio rerio]CAD60658.1 novel protein [Danio rerio]|eukprot:NP_001012249.1 peptidyl-prolyl cis-trans isomerase FKBP11 precursor [Danio rerio]